MHASPANVRRIPIRTINFDDPADKQRHDDMVAMVERMLALKAEEAALEDWDDQRHDLAQQIARLDGEIDALVYALYGLTDEEIAIVAG